MFAEPTIWRTYHSPRVSPSIEVFENVATPSGKCPHMITECVHTLRTRLATTLAVRVAANAGIAENGLTRAASAGFSR